ncbi:hypothetical protein [Ignavibacterium sp.]|uniref:hypothetical protein n=1 Tax=Ignavibacterium sp. TaxID=2651167 RepID=UPI00307EB172
MEINPQSNIVPEYPVAAFTPCGPWITSYDEFNPWQVVWNQISFAPDPYQQMFNFQDNRYGPGLQRRTYKFDPDKTYNITLIQDDQYAYFTYGGFYDNSTGSYVPIQYVGSSLSGVPGSDLGATGLYDYSRDYPNGLYHNDSKYRMKIKRDVPPGTEITVVAFDGQQTINYHTRVETPTFTIESITDEDTLLHYYSREIEFRLNFQQSGGSCQLDGYGGAYPVGIKFNVEIVQGQEYGNLYYPGTVAEPEQSGTSITNIDDEYGIGIANYTIKYKADGMQPDSLNPGIVTIRCSANDLDIAPVEVSFPVKYNTDPPEEGGIILVNFNKDSFAPGDTATTNCKWLTAYNELLDFPAEQSFNVVITGGSEFGMLLDPNTGTIADNLQGVSNGFKVITATSIPYDSVIIRLKVNSSVGNSGFSRMITNQFPKSEIKENNIADNDNGTKTITPDFFIITPGQEIEGFGDIIVKEDECDTYQCNEVIMKPNLTYENYIDGTFGTTACIDVIPDRGTGVFQTVTKATYRSYNQYFDLNNIKACYDINLNRWKFGHKLFLYPYFKVILDTCPNNAIQFGYKPISSISDIKFRYGDSLKLCLAKVDLEGHRNYPNMIRPGGYVFMQVDYSHELAHGLDYKNLIDSLQNVFLYPSLDSLQLGCFQISDIDQAKKIYKEELIRLLVGKTNINGDIIFSGLENRLSTGYKNHSEGSYLINGKLLSYEEYINNFPIVENTINVLMADFKNIWNCK